MTMIDCPSMRNLGFQIGFYEHSQSLVARRSEVLLPVSDSNDE